MFGGVEAHRGKRFTRGRWTGAASPVRFVREQSGGWIVVIGLSGFPIAKGPANSVSEGMRIFRDAEARYWGRNDMPKCKGRKGGKKK